MTADPTNEALQPERKHALALSQERLWARLRVLGIETTTVAHAPVFTVAEARTMRGTMPGGHCKSLFLRDKRHQYLLVALEDRRVDLKALRRSLGAGNLSFASAERLVAALGVEPGSVTPFALINAEADAESASEPMLSVLLDSGMLALGPLNYHPLSNDATTAIAPADLIAFIRSCGYQPRAVDLDGPEPVVSTLPDSV